MPGVNPVARSSLQCSPRPSRKTSPRSTYISQDLAFDFQDEYYEVHNYDYVERGGDLHLRRYVRVGQHGVRAACRRRGIGRRREYRRRPWHTTPVEPYPSTAIGGLGSASACLTWPLPTRPSLGGGIHREPYSIERIDRNSYGQSETVYDHQISGRRVLTGNEAAVATEVQGALWRTGRRRCSTTWTRR